MTNRDLLLIGGLLLLWWLRRPEPVGQAQFAWVGYTDEGVPYPLTRPPELQSIPLPQTLDGFTSYH